MDRYVNMLLILEALVWCFHILDRMSSKSCIYSGPFLLSVFYFIFRDIDGRMLLDIFDEKLHPLSVRLDMKMKFHQFIFVFS